MANKKELIKRIFTGSIIFSLVLFQGLVFLPLKTFAASPVFNNSSQDPEMLVMKNRTQGSTSWQDPISANAGDKIAFDVYYHNTVSGTIARNTKVRLDFAANQNNKLSFNAYVWADNANYVTNGGTVNVPCSGLAFTFDKVAKWYPNGSSTPQEVTVTVLQSNSILVNIGDVAGGWDHRGEIVFEGTVSKRAPAFNYHDEDPETLVLKNRTKGTPTWQDPISADGGDTIAFDVYYHNGTLCSTAKNTKISIIFPEDEGNKIVVAAKIDADNSNPVSDQGVINVSGMPEKLTFKTTALWYPNGSSTSQEIPVTISGNVATVNLGDIEGCWEYRGEVVFEAELSKTPSPTPTPSGKPEVPEEEIPEGQVLGAYSEKEIPKVPVTGASSTIALSLVSSVVGYGAIMRKKIKEKLLGSRLKSAISAAKEKKGL